MLILRLFITAVHAGKRMYVCTQSGPVDLPLSLVWSVQYQERVLSSDVSRNFYHKQTRYM
jgi:hypothetical protein